MTEKYITTNERENSLTGLTRWEQALIDDYLLDFNWSRAFKKTYGHEAVQYAQLRKPHVKKYIALRLEERREALKLDQTFIVEKLLSIVNADLSIFVNKFYKAEEINDLPNEIKLLIKGATLKESPDGTRTYKIDFMDKDKALELLGKHVGAFSKDNEVNVNHKVKGFAELVRGLNGKKEKDEIIDAEYRDADASSPEKEEVDLLS